MIDRFVAALRETELELDWRDIADVLWLADVRARDAASKSASPEPTAKPREVGGPATSYAADTSPVPATRSDRKRLRPSGQRLASDGTGRRGQLGRCRARGGRAHVLCAAGRHGDRPRAAPDEAAAADAAPQGIRS